MKIVFLFFALWVTEVVGAQKINEKVIGDDSIQFITITTDNLYALKIHTSSVKNITAKVSVEGEHNDEVLITTQQTQKHLSIGASYQPLFKPDDDKLAAHKQLSICMEVTVPKGKNVLITGMDTETYVTGIYEELQVFMHHGNCYLTDVQGAIKVTTYSGKVAVNNYEGVVKATSDYGEVLVHEIKKETYILTIYTVKGNISVNTTK